MDLAVAPTIAGDDAIVDELGAVSHRTRTEPTPDGFVVHDPLQDASIRVIAHGTHFQTVSETSPRLNQHIGLFEYRKLVQNIAEALTAEWRPRDREPPRGLRAWKIHQFRAVVGKPVHREWRRLLEQADPFILEVQRALFAAMCSIPKIAFEPELYQRRGLAHDIVRYRACALTVANAGPLVQRAKLSRVEGSMALAEARRLADASGINIVLYPMLGATGNPPVGELLEALDDWVGLLSPTERGYPNLYKTLIAMPGGMPTGIVRGFPLIQLSRPITARLELMALLFVTQGGRRDRHASVFMAAGEKDIKRAMAMVARFTHQELRHRKAAHVLEFVRFVCDYPDECAGKVVGLTRKSIAWHRDELDRAQARVLSGLDPQTETARPPIELPNHPDIRFLATVQEVRDEGASMNHCVAAYARDAVQGQHYLFHVEYGGEKATVQVDWHGRVVQAQGPRNRPTKASSWGRRMLARWGARFPAEPPPPQHDSVLALPFGPGNPFDQDVAF